MARMHVPDFDGASFNFIHHFVLFADFWDGGAHDWYLPQRSLFYAQQARMKMLVHKAATAVTVYSTLTHPSLVLFLVMWT
jgi:hypothetical protein